jgi:hypothetical protein
MTTNKDQQNTRTIFGMPILHEGYLTKRGAEWHTWRRRWFVLTNTALFYFRHKTVITSNSFSFCNIVFRNLTNKDPYLVNQKNLGFCTDWTN